MNFLFTFYRSIVHLAFENILQFIFNPILCNQIQPLIYI